MNQKKHKKMKEKLTISCCVSGIKISSSLYAWLAVLVLPVNSALNPVLYTLTTTAFKQQVSSRSILTVRRAEVY